MDSVPIYAPMPRLLPYHPDATRIWVRCEAIAQRMIELVVMREPCSFDGYPGRACQIDALRAWMAQCRREYMRALVPIGG